MFQSIKSSLTKRTKYPVWQIYVMLLSVFAAVQFSVLVGYGSVNVPSIVIPLTGFVLVVIKNNLETTNQ